MKVSKRVQSKPAKTGNSSKFLRVFTLYLALCIGIFIGFAGIILLISTLSELHQGQAGATTQDRLAGAFYGLAVGVLTLLLPATFSVFRSIK